MAKVSVIVPIYKTEAYLRECIDSILSQTFRDFELILIDDGSPDNCGKIIDDYAGLDSRIRAVHKENGGPSSARNAGLEIASCPYVYFPDSDDILEPHLLETVIPKMDEGYDMTVFGFDIFPEPDEATKRNMAYKVSEEKELILGTDEERFEFITGPFRRRAIRWELWNRVFRRDIIEKWNIRFGEDRRVFAEDMYFTYFYMAHTSRIMLLPDALYRYRRYEGSGSTEYKKHLMIYSSNHMTEAFYEHCRGADDCRYLCEHFLPLYYLLHKGALRRLRRYQWKKGLSTAEARNVLEENIADYPAFLERMTEMYNDPLVIESYRKDRDRMLQITDRLYTAELLDIGGPAVIKGIRTVLLNVLKRLDQ